MKLKLSIFIRIWLAFAIVLMIGGVLFFTNLEKHVKPTAQQVVEDTLIDTTRVLASIVSHAVADYQRDTLHTPQKQYTHTHQHDDSGQLTQPSVNTHLFEQLKESIDQAFQQNINARVWNNHKQGLDFHIYITNQEGIVIYDSHGKAVGQDYSSWNDVYLTLKGKYGARSSQLRADNPTSSVMYVAAPIYDVNDTATTKNIIGTISVGKPNASLLPYLDVTYQKMVKTAFWVGLASLILSALVALWIRRSIHLVNRYTKSLATKANKPNFLLASELNDLSNSIEKMRDELENKAYVTQYVHTLTHELKSPITAIQASSELLAEDLPENDRLQFSDNIHNQCQKLQGLVERMLLLAKLEQPNFKLNKTRLNLLGFMQNLLAMNHSKIKTHAINTHLNIADNVTLLADKFWFEQAVQNILENAINFCEGDLYIKAKKDNDTVTLTITNTGKHIPEYALLKLFDRYFSLPKHEKSSKGTGIGLTLVKEVMDKHGWHVAIANDSINDENAVTVTFSGLN